MTDHHNEHEFCDHDRLKRYRHDLLAERGYDWKEFLSARDRAHMTAERDINKAKIDIGSLCSTLRTEQSFSARHIQSFSELLDYTKHTIYISWSEETRRDVWTKYTRECNFIIWYSQFALKKLRFPEVQK
jgi:hypothetical protein